MSLLLFFVTLLNQTWAKEQTLVITPQTNQCTFTEVTDENCITEKKGNYGTLNHVRRLNTVKNVGLEYDLYMINYFSAISCENAKNKAKYSSYNSLKSAFDTLLHDYREHQKNEVQNYPLPSFKNGFDLDEQMEEQQKPRAKFELIITYDDTTGEVLNFYRAK